MFAYAKPEQKQSSKDTVQKKEPAEMPAYLNQTGIPDAMKTRFENLSGFSFDDVRVHYNSDKPAQLQALAYTQGNQVYVAPGQERHLGHELGHVVQQKEGRVRPTININRFAVNDNDTLEKEADNYATIQPKQIIAPNQDSMQTQSENHSGFLFNDVRQLQLDNSKLNVVGENHPESNARRYLEKDFCRRKTGSDNYWKESEFIVKLEPTENKLGYKQHGDPFEQRCMFAFAYINEMTPKIDNEIKKLNADKTQDVAKSLIERINSLKYVFEVLIGTIAGIREKFDEHTMSELNQQKSIDMHNDIIPVHQNVSKLNQTALNLYVYCGKDKKAENFFVEQIRTQFDVYAKGYGDFKTKFGTSTIVRATDYQEEGKYRSFFMEKAANIMKDTKGVWKIGDEHRKHIETIEPMKSQGKFYNLISRTSFNDEYETFERDIISKAQQTREIYEKLEPHGS